MAGKLCAKVCPDCKFQVQIAGRNPNTGAEIMAWDCALKLQYLMILEGNSKMHQLGAAIESFRNETAKRADDLTGGAVAIARAAISTAERAAILAERNPSAAALIGGGAGIHGS
jgi:hypothetical protein